MSGSTTALSSLIILCYRLSCGHSFCYQCLRQWFETALAGHRQEFPAYNPSAPLTADIEQARINLQYLTIPQRDELFMAIQQTRHGPEPVYICPLCRSVTNRQPVVNYELKGIADYVCQERGTQLTFPYEPLDLWRGFFG